MTTNALATRNAGAMLPDAGTWQTMLGMAESLVQSGLLPAHIKTPAAAVAIIQKGRELDIPPMYALSNIVVIQGKPTANAELMLALIYRDHGDGAVTFTESTNERCVVAYRRRGWSQPRSYAFTIGDAETAGLMKNPTWRTYPAAMLRARAISAVARMAFPDTIGGLYTPEELGAAVDADGDVIDIDEGKMHHALAFVEGRMTQQPESDTIVAGAAEVIDAETGEIQDGPRNPSQMHPASDKQIKAIFAIGKDAGWTNDELREVMVERFGVEHSRDLTIGQASEFIDFLKAGAEPQQSLNV